MRRVAALGVTAIGLLGAVTFSADARVTAGCTMSGPYGSGRVPGKPAGTPPKSVRFVLLAGDRDDVVGTAGAQDFLTWLETHPTARKTYRLIRSSAALTASHEAPKERTPAATRAFWTPIDVLVSAARGSR